MDLKFFKYQAQGNDFILIDDRKTEFISTLNNHKIKKICDRKFGIGADGLLIIKDAIKYDFELIYFNADGSQSFCSNGSRCAVNYFNNLNSKNEFIFNSFDGVHKAVVDKNDIELEMKVYEIEKIDENYYINTGAPHLVCIEDDINKINIAEKAKNLKNKIKKDLNVTFMSLSIIDNCISATTFEKGVEGETLACGTGAVAAAICSNIKHNLSSPIKVKMKGGNLEVRFKKHNEKEFLDIFIKGENPGEKVFEGIIKI